MTDQPARDVTVVVPLALTDFAKALRELIGVFRDLAGLVKDGSSVVRRREARSRAADLDALGFPPNGMFRPLSRIADGCGLPQDFGLLENLMNETAPEVERDVQALRAYRDTIRVNCGAKASQALDNLLDGSAGKFEIRYAIYGLVNTQRQGGEPSELQARAKRILQMIEAFNEQLIDLHDKVLPPRGAP